MLKVIIYPLSYKIMLRLLNIILAPRACGMCVTQLIFIIIT